MMMEDDTEWGPRIDRPADGWPEGKCPIPWAKAGEYQLFIAEEREWFQPTELSAAEWEFDWDSVPAYRVRADMMSRPSQPAAHDVVEKMAEALRQTLNFCQNTEAELGITLSCADAARAALAAYEASKETRHD